MPEVTDWLPELVLFEDFGGDWEAYLAAIYEHFCDDFIRGRPHFPPKRLNLKRHPVINGKEATFWHFISEGKVEEDRIPDFRRCERIRWPKAVIESYGTERVNTWDALRNGENRIHIALKDFSYLVVLADRGEYVLPWTAFSVEQEHRRNRLKAEFERFQTLKNARAAPFGGGPVTPSTHGR